jgi:hypothetical protein
MGNRLCGPATRSMESQIDKQIEDFLKEEKQHRDLCQKVLFLGGCNAGKSTVMFSLVGALNPDSINPRSYMTHLWNWLCHSVKNWINWRRETGKVVHADVVVLDELIDVTWPDYTHENFIRDKELWLRFVSESEHDFVEQLRFYPMSWRFRFNDVQRMSCKDYLPTLRECASLRICICFVLFFGFLF